MRKQLRVRYTQNLLFLEIPPMIMVERMLTNPHVIRIVTNPSAERMCERVNVRTRTELGAVVDCCPLD